MLMNLLAVDLREHFGNLAVGGNAHAIQLALVGSGHQAVSCGSSLAIGGILLRDCLLYTSDAADDDRIV